ncbi:MAG: H-X9-DG-CTERM domain-containing protein [Armatimonadia bacterium]
MPEWYKLGNSAHSLGEVKAPAETMLLFEYNGTASRYISAAANGTLPDEFCSIGAICGTTRCVHNDGANIGYCDGHAKWGGQSTLVRQDIRKP